MSALPRPRNQTKAHVRFEHRGSREVAIKDFSGRPMLLRVLVGRPSLRREARVYERLDGLRGIPKCLGFEGPDALVLERVNAEVVKPELIEGRGERVFARAERLLSEIHGRGVAIADLHGSNLLVGPDDEMYMLDFALARIARKPNRPGALVRQLMRLDRHALARIRAKCLGEPEPQLDGWFGKVYRSGRWLKARIG